MKKISVTMERKTLSAAEILKKSLVDSDSTLKDHRASAVEVNDALDNGYMRVRKGHISVNKANQTYNRAITNINSIGDSSTKLNEFASGMEKHNIKTRQMKAKFINIVKQFTQDSKSTGNDIVSLQEKIKSHVNNNTAEILEMINLDRENNFNSLTSVKLRKGINRLSDKLGVPITRGITTVSATIFGIFGYKLGRHI